MKFTRAIALCALTLAIALAIGAISPYQPYASAGNLQPIFSNAPAHVVPTPALPTAVPVTVPVAVPVAVQLAAPPPQVIYVHIPPPQVIYIQDPAAAPADQGQAAAPADQGQAAAPADQGQAANVYADLPVLQCPCGVDAPAAPVTDAQRAYSRARTR